MDKDSVLNDIFNNDPLGLLVVKPKVITVRNADERLLASFLEINDYFEKNSREPQANPSSIGEYMLYTRLKSLRESQEKMASLKPFDKFNLLQFELKEINSIDDIFNDSTFDLLSADTEGLFDFKHTPKDFQRASAEFIAKRKPCKDFEKYEHLFKEVQQDLANKKRKLIEFGQKNLIAGSYYVHNGVLFYLESISITRKEHYRPDGTRVFADGRTRCIFENGTESNMLKRSVEKILYSNGSVVTDNIDKVNQGFLESFGTVSKDDVTTGFIYILKSKSNDSRITSLKNLYKIGYSTTSIELRIKNAEKEPTYLMAPVEFVTGWQCLNMNPQKLENLLHNFFGSSCLNIDVIDENGLKHCPREWFIAPLEVIEQTIELIINGKILNYQYDPINTTIVRRS